MLFLRALMYYGLMVVSLAWVYSIGALMWGITEPLQLTTRLGRIRRTQGFNRFMTNWAAPRILGLHYRVRGLARLPRETPMVFMMKHQSAWETIASAAILPLHTWVLKRELMWIPLFGWGLRLVDPVPIEREDPRKALKHITQEGKERLASGLSLVIFPEGTRAAPRSMGVFKAGGAFLAKQCGVMVVPVAHNAGHFWRKNSFLKTPGTITVVVGKPFSTVNLSTAEINRRVVKWMRRVMAVIEA